MQKTRHIAIFGWLALLLAPLNIASAQEAKGKIEETIRSYFTAMAERDGEALRALLNRSFVVVEARPEKARTQVLDTRNQDSLLPPEGNDDWAKDKTEVASIKVELTETHPSVATAAIVVRRRMDDQRVAGLQEVLKIQGEKLDQAKRKALTRWIEIRATEQTMLAMLALQDGNWRIVSMSFPK